MFILATIANSGINILAEEKKTEAPKKEEKTETAKASDDAEAEKEAETVVDEALDNAEVEDNAVAATTEAEEPTVYDKYKQAFSLDNFNIS